MRMIFLPLLLLFTSTNFANAFQVPLPSLVMDSGDHNCTAEAARRCILAVEDSTDSCDYWWGDDIFLSFYNCIRAQARAGLSCVDCYVIDASKFMWSCDEAHFRQWLDTIIWGWDTCKSGQSDYGCADILAFIVGSSYDCTCESIPFLVNLGLCPFPFLPVPWPPTLEPARN